MGSHQASHQTKAFECCCCGWIHFLVVVEKTVWALGDVAGDGPELRDHVIEQGIIKPLLQLIVLETWLNLINLII